MLVPIRRYFDNEVSAHDAAIEESKTNPCGIFVREDSKGFYLSIFGELGTSCYFNGRHESEFEWDNEGPV